MRGFAGGVLRIRPPWKMEKAPRLAMMGVSGGNSFQVAPETRMAVTAATRRSVPELRQIVPRWC